MLVKKAMLLKCKFLGLAAVILLLGACADEVVVEESLPSALSNEIPFDAQKASIGEGYYKQKCVACHGDDGLATGYDGITTITPSKHATEDALASNKLMAYTEANMPPPGLGECNGECADAIQNYFYKRWSDSKGQTSSAAGAASSSTAAITLPDRNVPNFKGDVNVSEVAKGKQLYTQHNCGICHGAVGGYDGQILTPPVQSPIHNNLDYYVVENKRFNDLYFAIHDTMPLGNPTSCENDCAQAVAEYIKSWTAETGEYVAPASSSSAMSSSAAAVSSSSVTQSSSSIASSSAMSSSSSSLPPVPTGPTQAEINARVAAGKTAYADGSNTCSVCHGADGKVAGFDLITDSNKTYAEISALISSGKGAMPACKVPSGICGPTIADYVWVELLGKKLTK